MMKQIDWSWAKHVQQQLGQKVSGFRRQTPRHAVHKHVVSYSLPYSHDVMVGITAQSPDRAIATAEALFDEASIWDDTPEVPLLRDDYEETDDGTALTFQIEETLDVNAPWPAPCASVAYIRQREAAFQAARELVAAYQRGQANGGFVDWNELDTAYYSALRALGRAS